MENKCLHIDNANYIRDFIIEITFDDGTKKVVDVSPLLTGEMFEPLKDPRIFAKLTIDPISKTIVWPNGADIAPEALNNLPAAGQVA